MKALMKFALAALLAGSLPAHSGALQPATYSGPCDASAAVALDTAHFVVGDDERNTLHIYRQGQAQEVGSLDLSQFLATAADKESDIEGVAAIGTRIYWITSHGRNSKGKARPSRHRFFATEIVPGQPPTLKPVGQAYVDLLRDMSEAKPLKPYRLGDAGRLAAEAEGGLNIEGLAATPDGALLIGLRNPLRQQRALVIPLLNPGEVIADSRARFGTPIELDLDRRGIRSIERIGASYLIVAGPSADRGSFALFRWSGQSGDQPTPVTESDLKDLRPEALFGLPGGNRAQLLSDDGGVVIGGVECKELPEADQSFRSLTIMPKE